MKAKIIEKEKEKKFEPITIELTIENERELCELWHRLNISESAFSKEKYRSKDRLKYTVSSCTVRLYDVVDAIVIDNNLKQ